MVRRLCARKKPSVLGRACYGLGFQALTGTEGVGFEPTEAFTSLVFKTRCRGNQANGFKA